MPLIRKPKQHPADQLVVCVESFGTGDPLGGCREGTRLMGDHPKVIRWPQYFAAADLPDDELERVRKSLYPEGQAFRT